MNPIQAAVQTLLPPNRKLTTGGWVSFNAVCCHNRGDRPDTKKRGGVMFTDEGFTYHCFNCGFKAGWSPGKLFSANTKSLFRWLGMSDIEVSKLGLTILKFKEDLPVFKKPLNFMLEERPLPEGAMLLKEWAQAVWKPGADKDMVRVFEYLVSRGMDLDWYDWMWTPTPGYKDRLLIPFYQDGKVVGYTGRKITEGNPKYLTDSQNGYVFNIDRQTYHRSYVIVVEGQFDAIAIDGVGIMTNDPNETQCARINSLAREVIVVPDKDRPGAKLLKAAVEHNWSASMPPWDDTVKDVADAVKKYGRLYTLTTILHYKETNEIKIKMMQKKLEGLNDE